jgi:hypothetical protein
MGNYDHAQPADSVHRAALIDLGLEFLRFAGTNPRYFPADVVSQSLPFFHLGQRLLDFFQSSPSTHGFSGRGWVAQIRDRRMALMKQLSGQDSAGFPVMYRRLTVRRSACSGQTGTYYSILGVSVPFVGNF